MSEGIAVAEERKSSTRSCRHHWVIETPHGVTSRGLCRRCGTTRRFPNAAEDARWDKNKGSLGRWSARRGAARPAEFVPPKEKPDLES